MATYFTDHALCLRVIDFSETSQVVSLLTANHGLIPMIAKGAKRVSKNGTSTFSGSLDLLVTGQAVFIPAKAASDLATLTAWQLLNHQTRLRTALPALYSGMLCAEITLALLHPHDPHPEVFTELTATLDLLPTPQQPRALVAYSKAALVAAGYQPQLDTCVTCARPITADEPAAFSARAGGILCANCQPNVPAKTLTPVSGRIALALDRLPAPHEILATPPENTGDPVALRQALLLLLSQIETISERPLRTRSILPLIFPDPG